MQQRNLPMVPSLSPNDVCALILCPMQSSSGNILDDLELIEALNQSKQASIAVKARMHAAAIASDDIQTARSAYASVPNRAAAIFYAAQALSAVNTMYQLSLECFRSLLLRSLQTAAKSDILKVCVHQLLTKPVYLRLQNIDYL